jgi:Transcription-silencing protein, cryptic loci regulator Clr2/Transcription-silencing protein Clr2
MLKELPEGYTLWEHAGEEDDGNADPQQPPTAATGKRHGKDRVDTYLYGHPGGKTKRFRSPLEFYPHLLWLCTGRGTCQCKHCKSSLKDVVERQYITGNNHVAQKKAVEDTTPVPEEKVATEPKNPLSSIDPQLSFGQATIKTCWLLKHPTTGIKTVSTTPLPRDTRSLEQKFDSEPNGVFIYRPGELVWFNKGSAWGLAVVCLRQIMSSIPHYLLQPLSHPLKHLPPLIKDQELIRPWLAWSVPSTTHAEIAHLTYDQVPWDQALNGKLGSGDAEVDGSILAAKRIDGSYTLFDRLGMPTAAPGEVFYTGMFLGAEKIWVGEPVRVRAPGDDVVVMVLQHIIETAVGTTSYVTLVGDIYKFVEMPTPYKSQSEWPTPDLPARMVSDLRFRNEVAENARRAVWHEWRLLGPMARKPLEEIKGRWYETQSLLPILRGVEFQHEISKGVTSDAGGWMNGRGDSSNRAGQRKKNRLDTLGKAVPQDLKISRGLNGPPSENVFPMEQPNVHMGHGAANEGQYGSVGGVADGEMDQFMDLDHTGENQGLWSDSMQR